MRPPTEKASTPTILADCPAGASCVSSQARRSAQRVEPLACGSSCAATLQELRRILDSTRGATIVESTDTYLHAEFRTRVFHFIDDLELLIDADESVIHARSASRIGSWDLGVNRRRVERLRRRLARSQP